MKFKEEQIQRALMDYLAPMSLSIQKEVETPVGYIDILRCREDRQIELIEIKESRSVKHAFGQVLSYRRYYPADILTVVYFHYKASDIGKGTNTSYFAVAEQSNIQLVNVHSLIDVATLDSYSFDKYKKKEDIICVEQEEHKSMDMEMRMSLEKDMPQTVLFQEERLYDSLERLQLPEW